MSKKILDKSSFWYVESECPLVYEKYPSDPSPVDAGVEIKLRRYEVRQSCFKCKGCEGTDGDGCTEPPRVVHFPYPNTYQIRRPGARSSTYFIYFQWPRGLPETGPETRKGEGGKKMIMSFRNTEDALQMLKTMYAVTSKEAARDAALEVASELPWPTSPPPPSSQP